MNANPRVSVVLPVHNADLYIRGAVESILRQSYRELELLVLDDGSTDTTPAIVHELSKHDPRLRAVCAPRQGLVPTLNQGCEQARGTYIARMDSDDIAFPRRIEAQVRAMEEAPDLGLVGAAVVMAGDDLRPRYTLRYPCRDDAIRKALENGSSFAHPVVMMRKSTFERAGGYRPEFLHAEDYDLWLRMAEHARLANLPQPLLCYRVHSGQVSLTHGRQQIVSVVGAQLANSARATGKGEPFPSGRPISLDALTLAARGERHALPNRLVAAATSAATTMIVMGQPQPAVDLLDWVCSIAPHEPLSRSTAARLNLAYAAAHWSQRQLWQAIRSGLLACTIDPLVSLSLAWTAARAFALMPRAR